MKSEEQLGVNAVAVPQRGLPVTIITGFLGSGKTTLLNHILTNQSGFRTAVMVNEFGEIGIDSELIVSSEEDLVELNNGCMCCTIRDDVATSVLNLLERAENGIDYLIVETTGLADPLPVALTFLGPDLRDLTRLDSIVTLVDASNFAPDLFDSDVALSQITYGDVILLNKTDLVNAEEVVKVERRIRTIKEGARILKTTNSQAALGLLLDTSLFDSTTLPEEESVESEHHHEHDHHEHEHDAHGAELKHHHHEHDVHGHELEHHHHEHHHHHHSNHLENEGFNSLAFAGDRPFNLDKFQTFLNDLPEAIFRAKGILWFDESPERYIFHLSGKRYTIDSEAWPEGQEPSNQIVLIGQHLDTRSLRRRLELCLEQPAGKSKGFS
ncbi:MAG: GTP-binding protein [Cyanobacteria bacterium J06642_2]